MSYNTRKWYQSRKFIKEVNSGNKKFCCVFQERVLIGCLNYGEIPDTLNPADGDPWDVCAFGYTRPFKRNTQYVIERFRGELCLPNGNHKLIPVIRGGKFCHKRFVCEIITYKNIYETMKGWKRGSIKLRWFK